VKLFQDSGGTWHAGFPDQSGNHRIICCRTRERLIAETVGEVLAAEVALFSGASETVPTVEEVIGYWVAEKEFEIEPQTLLFYRQVTNDFLLHMGSRATDKICTLTRRDIVDYRTAMAGQVRARTVNHRLKTLRSVLDFAVRERFLRENPAAFVKTIKNSEPRVRRPFTLDEVRSILAVATPEWKLMILFGLYTGQRLGDISRLEWKNFDLESETKTISLVTRKTKKQITIPIAGPLLKPLMEWRNLKKNATGPVHPKACESVALHQGRVAWLSNQFASLMARAGLRAKAPHHIIVGNGRAGKRQRSELSFHCLRHTAVTLLKEAGVPQAVVMELVGHDSEAISASYTHVGIEALRKAAAALPEV
jgi:integrase